MSKYVEVYRETLMEHFENHLKSEKRAGDDKLVQAPKGLSAKVWQVAIDISVIVRIAQKNNAVVSRALATQAVLEMYAHDPELLAEIWPLGPKQMDQQLLTMMIHLPGLGFGSILFAVARMLASSGKK